MSFRDELANAAERSGTKLEARLLDACAAHFDLLLKWNRTHNLTRVTDPAEAARKHYLDCLVPLLALKEPEAFADIGSGAGFPGLLAAAAWPSAKATLVEPAGKRASFLQLAGRAMGVTVAVIPPAKGSSLAAGTPVPEAPVTGPVVLSRATFSPGARASLASYADANAGICVWGHRHDAATWEIEVSTWRAWRTHVQDYAVDGLEPRALLWATRGVFHVERRPTN